MYETLNKINGPEDVKKLNIKELESLAKDIREALFNRLTKIGGHCGPNLSLIRLRIRLFLTYLTSRIHIRC